MDYDGHVFQVAATLTPLKQVDGHPPQPNKPTNAPVSINVSKFL